ncbi:glycosyltransferase [Pelagibacterales bacterium SAG-MED39]|nr:glycosyltransferase [Pelagibacterales bacterium SAG-MED39]
MKKKNLIFFIPEFVKGGAGNSIVSLCKNINKNFFFINIICLGKCEYKRELSQNIKIFELDKKRTLFAQFAIRKIISSILSNSLKTIFISNFFYANVLVGLFQKKDKNIKYIFTERTTLSELYIYFGIKDFLKKNIIKLLVKILYRKADLVIANSKKVSKDLKLFANCITNHVYPGTFKKFNKKKFNKKKVKHILWVGRLAKEKGLEILLKGFRKIDKKRYKLKIIGSGPLRNELARQVKDYNLNNNIELIGYKKNISAYLKKSDLLINTSYFEGFPNVVIEALSNSVPVISSKSKGGIYEILKDGAYGNLFDLDRPNDLTKKINFFLKNPEDLNKKAQASKKHLFKFEKKKSAKNYEKIFLNL